MTVDSAARPLDRGSPMPLWAQLQDELARRLTSGQFDAGFPGEMDLVQTYDVSRHTVREALRRLREAGILESSRGRVTQVRRRIEQPLGSLHSLFREVEARGMRQTSEVLVLRREERPEAAAALGLGADTALVYLERVRLADGEPLAHDRAWLLPGSVLQACHFPMAADSGAAQREDPGASAGPRAGRVDGGSGHE